jgi:hypothetical protein
MKGRGGNTMLGVKHFSKTGYCLFRPFHSVLVLLFFIVSVTVVSANNLVDLGMTCGGQYDTIWIGESAAFDIHIENDTTLTAAQLGFYIWSPDDATWHWQDVGGYGSSTACVTVVPECRMDPPSSVWDGTDLIVSERDVDEVSPDSLLVAGVAAAGGLPSGSLEHMISFNFTAGPDADGVYHICIDSTWIPPTNDFIFMDYTGTYAPQVAWPSGGLCWPVKKFYNLAPIITNCPSEMLYAPMCEVFEYVLEAEDPEQGPMVFELTSYNGGGSAQVNPTSGLVTCNFVPGDIHTVVTVGARVCDQYTLCDTCNFDIEVTNEIPIIDCGVLEEYIVAGSTLVKSDIIGDDPDGCPDPLVYTVVSGPGMIHPNNGQYTWGTLTGDVGLWQVEIEGSDGRDADTCAFLIEVLAGDDCNTPISIDEFPFTYESSTGHYNDAIQPDPSQCGVADPGFGIGPDIVFQYFPDDYDTIHINVHSLSEWDVGLYVLDAFDPGTCLAGANDGGPLESEVITLEADPEMGYCIVVDGVDGSYGEVVFQVHPDTDTLCKKIERPANLAENKPAADNFAKGDKTKVKSLVDYKQSLYPKQKCNFGYKMVRKGIGASGIVYADVKISKKRAAGKKGWARAVVRLTGSYTLKPKPDYDDETGSLECNLSEYTFKANMNCRQTVLGASNAAIEYTRTIEPFHINQTYEIPGAFDGVVLWPIETDKLESIKTPGVIGSKKASVPFNSPQSIELYFRADALAGKDAKASAKIEKLYFKISCPDPPAEEGEAKGEAYPVDIEITGIEVTPLTTKQEATITLPPDFGQRFIEIDSGDYASGGIAYSNLPAFESRLFLADRINETEYDLGEEVPAEAPSDTSHLFTLSDSEIETFLTSDILSAPSDILFDTLGHFGNKLFVAQTDSFDSFGVPETGWSSIVSIDESGNLDTLANGLNSATGMAFNDGTPFGNNLYVAEPDIGQITAIDPAGNATPFAVGLKDPLDLVVGRGDFEDYLYINEYDTSIAEPFPQPKGGKIVRVDAAGIVTTFVDTLQGPVDMEFGPGGVFGTDLYVALDNEFSPDTSYVSNTGKIVVVNSLGVVQDFAAGLEYPQYITFDPSGVLYVGVAGGIMKIGPYVCGDANGDESVNLGDAVYINNLVFHEGPLPDPYEAGDANCDGSVNLGDAVYLINFIFHDGPEPCEDCP